MPYILLHCIGLLAAAPVEDWRQEIEQRYQTRISVIRVQFDSVRNEMRLPATLDDPAVARVYLTDAAFRQQFAVAHALTINLPDRHLIFLNLGFASQWAGSEDGLLAHELGHVWLDRQGFRAPPFVPGPRACLAIQSADIPQHALIRAETARRGLPWRDYLITSFRAALGGFESAAEPRLTPCQKVVLIGQWLDMRLSGLEADFDGYQRLNQLYTDRFPDLIPIAGMLETYLLQTNLNAPAAFARAVQYVHGELEKLMIGE